jgi:hypothetical protein
MNKPCLFQASGLHEKLPCMITTPSLLIYFTVWLLARDTAQLSHSFPCECLTGTLKTVLLTIVSNSHYVVILSFI